MEAFTNLFYPIYSFSFMVRFLITSNRPLIVRIERKTQKKKNKSIKHLFQVGRQISIRNMRKDNPTIKIAHQLLNIMFSFLNFECKKSR